MKRIDRIIKENISRYLREEFFYNIPPRQRRFYKTIPDESVNWVRVGEVMIKKWDNDEMKNIIIPLYFEVNQDQVKEIEEFKNTHDISQYVKLIQDIRKDFNVTNRDLFRFVDKNGKRYGIDLRYDVKDEGIKLYNEYKGTIYDDLLLGYNVDVLKYHQEFMNKLNRSRDKIVLIHSSADKITNGRVCSNSGQHKLYTPQSDMKYTFFWASGTIGSDNSGGDFKYYCEIDPQEIYDYSSNLENFSSQDEALSKYHFIAYYWKNEDVIVAKTNGSAEISYITYEGKTYNRNWQEI